jgi:hypothetical protein
MIIDTLFGKYLKAADLEGKPLIAKIALVAVETIGNDRRAVAYFEGMEKSLVLNKTNANLIKEITGSAETGNWIGTKIVLYPTRVDFQGKRVDSIRVDRVSDRNDGVDQRQRGGDNDATR